MDQPQNKNTIQIFLLNPDWVKRAHPLLMLFKGGHRAKAGEWFLEVHRVLHDIYKTFATLENFMNRGDKDLYVGENKDKVEIPPEDKLWALGYTVENAYLRIGSCLEKIAQMVRVYYEHPDHGGQLSINQRCGNCPPDQMTENNCSFGALVGVLHKQGRNADLDKALFTLEQNETLSKVKKARNDISHRINKTIFTAGIDPDIKVKVDGNVQETTFSFGRMHPTSAEYRELIADAHNEIATQLNIIGPIIFPESPTK